MSSKQCGSTVHKTKSLNSNFQGFSDVPANFSKPLINGNRSNGEPTRLRSQLGSITTVSLKTKDIT